MGKQNHQTSQSNVTSTLLRILVLGDRYVGKSALVVRFLTKRFIGEYASGMEMAYKQEVNFSGSRIATEICDSFISKDDQEASNHLQKVVSKCDACLIVHNICDKSSFDFAQTLATKIRFGQARSARGKEVPILMVGNKSDLEHLREVTVAEAREVAEHIGLCHFLETSAAESFTAVENVFRHLFRLVHSNSQILAAAAAAGSLASGTKPGRRRKSLTQVKQMFLDHYRKHPALGSRSLSLDGMMVTTQPSVAGFNPCASVGERLATVTTDKNNNNGRNNSSSSNGIKSTTTTTTISAAAAAQGSKYRSLPSKCRSLGTLSEQPENESPRHQQDDKQSSRTLPPGCHPNKTAKSSCRKANGGGSGEEGVWWRRRSKTGGSNSSPENSIRVSESTTEETVSLSDMSTADDDAFAHANEPNEHTSTDVILVSSRTITNGFMARASRCRSSRSSINRKNLKITVPQQLPVYSDGESPEKDSEDSDHMVPPSSAPALPSSRYRFFPTGYPLATVETEKSQQRNSSSEDKKSPTQRLLKMFFKGAMHPGQMSKAQALRRRDEVEKICHFSDDGGESFLYTAAKPMTKPIFLLGDDGDQNVTEICNDIMMTSAAQSRFKRKDRRRASLRETMGDIMRIRRRSNTGDCSKPTPDRLL